MAKNLPAGGRLVDKAGVWTLEMWAWMRDLTQQASGAGTVTDVTATSPIVSSGGTTPNISHAVSGVTAATYGDATNVPQIAVNVTGHITSASNVAITFPTPNIQTLLDTISTTQGVLLYYNGTDWVALGTGTDDDVLITNGAGANPSYANVSTLGYWSPLTNGDPVTPELIFDGSGDTIAVWTET